jgi:type III secretion protein W
MSEGFDPNITIQKMQTLASETAQELSDEQETSQADFKNWQSEAVNPYAARMTAKDKDLKAQRERVNKMLQSGEKTKSISPEQLKKSADQFEKRNPELRAGSLLTLRERVKPDSTPQDLLDLVNEFYPDPTLADEAFDFLLETTNGTLNQVVQQTKNQFKTANEVFINAGRNITEEARAAAEKGLGTPTNMRDLYRNIVGNPRDSTTLFQELSQKYAFKDLKKVTDFLLHSLGADMKAKGPSIPRGQLFRLLTETRSLQAILGVYRFFRGRMPLIQKQFAKAGLEVPPQLNFESLAKQFMSLAGERYPSGDKVLQTAVRLGVEKWLMAKIIALSQLRDAIREVAMNQIYRSIQHRDELFLAILEALEDLEDELDELLEKEDREREDQDDDEDSDEDEK